jgi:hypothetical protein
MPSDAENQASKYLSDLILQGKRDQEEALSRGETMGFATGEAARVNRNNQFAIDAASDAVNAFTRNRSSATDMSKARVDFERGLLDQDFKERSLEADDRRADDTMAFNRERLAEDRRQADRKFQEDKRQFGLEYALKQRELDQTASEKKAAAGATASGTLDAYSLADEILKGGNISAITGIPGISSFIPGTSTQYTKNQAKQLAAFLALENRQKLKGSGAISDYESRILNDAASALGLNPSSGRSSLKNKDFEREIKKVRGALGTAAGMAVPVRVSGPNGQSKIGNLDRAGIESAILQGYSVEYQ